MTIVGVFVPEVPKLTISKIDSAEEFQRIFELLRIRSDVFVGLPEQYELKALREDSEKVYYQSFGVGDDLVESVVFRLNDFLVVSDNGKHWFTSDRMVTMGVLVDAPKELFFPAFAYNVEKVQ